MNIIDSHCHLGSCSVFGFDINEESLISKLDENNICSAIVQPFPGAIPDAKSVHDRIYNLSQKYPKKIFGLASINPNLPKKEVKYELERCVKELGFVGIKCHTLGHGVNPLGPSGDLIFNTASRLKVPVNIHTGQGIVFGAPSLCIPKARQYPELKIVLAHSGMMMLLPEAFVAATECENIYLETSWTAAEDIKWLIESLGQHRVMFGSDAYTNEMTNQKVEIFKYNNIGLDDDKKNDVFFDTANKIFNLKL